MLPNLKPNDLGELDFVAFPFMPRLYVPRMGVATITRGICWQITEKFDNIYNESIRNFKEGGLDLCAMDMNRSVVNFA